MIGNANKSIQSLYVACLLQLMMVEQLATESQTPYIHEKRLWTHFLEIATHTKWPQTDAPTIWTVPENCAIGVCSMDFEFVPWLFQRPSRVDPNLDSYLIRSGLQNISIKYEGDNISCKKRQVVCLDAINMSNHYALHFSV